MRNEEELAEIYEESHSDFTVSLEIYDWPNGSWAGIYSIFGFFLYEDEVEQFGPYISLKHARSHLQNTVEANFSELPNVSDSEHSWGSPEVDYQLRKSNKINNLIDEKLKKDEQYDNNGSFTDEALLLIQDEIYNNYKQIDSFSAEPGSDLDYFVELCQWENLFWAEMLGEYETGFFFSEAALRDYVATNMHIIEG